MNILHRIEKWIDICVASIPRQKPAAGAHTKACIVAHRGAHDHIMALQENTLAAFERALHLGCYGIEFDVHATADGVLVVNHDPTLTRLWSHDVAISTLNFEELRALVPLLPSLAEVVAYYGKRMHLFIELKSPFTAIQALADALQTLTPGADYHLLCLDENIFPKLTMFPKKSMLVVPVHNNVSQFCKLSLQHDYGGVLGHYLLLNNRQVRSLQKAEQLVGVGFVDSKFSLYRELNRGVFYLFTNNAEMVTACLRELE